MESSRNIFFYQKKIPWHIIEAPDYEQIIEMSRVFSAFFIRSHGQVAGYMEDIRLISKTYHPTKGYPSNH